MRCLRLLMVRGLVLHWWWCLRRGWMAGSLELYILRSVWWHVRWLLLTRVLLQRYRRIGVIPGAAWQGGLTLHANGLTMLHLSLVHHIALLLLDLMSHLRWHWLSSLLQGFHHLLLLMLLLRMYVLVASSRVHHHLVLLPLLGHLHLLLSLLQLRGLSKLRIVAVVPIWHEHLSRMTLLETLSHLGIGIVYAGLWTLLHMWHTMNIHAIGTWHHLRVHHVASLRGM